jgi:hypothetical protein
LYRVILDYHWLNIFLILKNIYEPAVKRDADDRDMIDPLFIMKNLKLKLYCPAKLTISATTEGLSADCRICDHKKYDLKLRWLKNNKTQNSSIKAAIKTLYHDAERKEKRNILSCYSNFLLLNAWNPPYL